MLPQYVRVFYGDNGTLTDYSVEAQDASSTITIPIVAAEDYIYIGQYMPFNNFFIEVDTANDQASTMTVEYWDHKEWREVADIIDPTKASGVTLAQSGVVQYIPDDDYGWMKTADTTDTNAPTGLKDLIEIYNLYWLRLSFSNDLNAGTKINRITYKFTDQKIMEKIDPKITNFLSSWASGKTDWLDQILIASELLWLDLKGRRLIDHPGNILLMDDVYMACAYRALAVIYNELGGEKYLGKMNNAMTQYETILKNLPLTIDRNQNARIELSELNRTDRVLTR